MIAWNRAMEEMTGVRAKDMLGKGNYEYAIPFYGERRPILIDLVMIQDPDVLNKYSSVQKSGDSLTAETNLTRLGGKDLYLWEKSILLKNSHGEVIGAIESIRDITAWKHTEMKLVAATEHLKEAHHLAHIGTWDWIIKTDTVTWSEELCTIAGWDPSLPAPTYADLPRIYSPASWEQLSAAVTNALNTGEPYNLDLEMIRPDGTIRWTNAFGGVIRDTKGKITGLHGTVQDITESKRAEAALAESFATFRTVMDSIDALVYVADMKTYEILFVNEYGRKIWGDISGKICWEALQVNQRGPCPFCTNNKLLDSEGNPARIVIWEFKNTINGHWYECHDSAIRWTDGRIVRIEIATDITKRKWVEEEIAESEDRFRGIFDTITSGVAIYEVLNNGASGKDYIIKDFNKTALEIEGKTKEEIVGKSLFDLRPAIDEYGLIPVFQQVWKTGVPAYFPQKVYIDEKYSSWYENRVFRLHSGEIVAVYDDVTERKRAEEALKESEFKYRSLIESSSDAIFCVDQQGTYKFTNQVFASTFNKTPEFFIGKTFWDIYPKEHADYRQLTNLAVFETGVTQTIEVEVPLPDTTLYFIAKANPIKDESGKVILNLTHATDITGRKTTEKMLLETTEYLQNLFDYANAPIIVWDPEYVITRFNHAFEDLTLISEQEAIGQKLDILFPEESRDASLIEIKKTLEGERWKTVEIPILVKDGSVRTVLWNSANILDIHGRITSTIAQGVDITDRKEAGEALKEREQDLVEAQKIAQLGKWDLDLVNNTLHWSDGIYEMFEINPALFGATYEAFLNCIHPDDRDMVNSAYTGSLKNRQPYEISHRLRMVDGRIKWVNEICHTEYNSQGQPLRSVGIVQDISRIKQAEEALILANKKLNLLSSITRHDINNQLSVLRGYISILEKKLPDPALSDYFLKSSTAAQRISSMIQFTKEYEDIGVNAPVWKDCDNLIDTATKQAPLGMVTVINEIPAGTKIFADPLIVKVFFNLMDNAVRHGGKITTIRFSSGERGADHILVCEDDGDGVLPEEKEKIFLKGYGKNTGMGLFLSREILSITGITIRETGESGKGARFEIAVPKGAWRTASKGA